MTHIKKIFKTQKPELCLVGILVVLGFGAAA